MNASGIEPVEYNLLIKQAEVPKQTKGGLLLPDEHHERVQWAETRATIVAMSPLAFNFEVGAPKPKVGEMVIIAKHSGVEVVGDDEQKYRIIKDKDVIAVVRKPE